MKQPVQQKRPNESRGSTQVQGSYEQSVQHGTCMITDTSCESQHATRRTLHHSLRLAGTFDGGVFVSEQLRDDVWLDETTTAGRLQRCSPVRILPIQVNMIPDSSSRYRATMLIQIERCRAWMGLRRAETTQPASAVAKGTRATNTRKQKPDIWVSYR